jgi:hypothetical protein
MSSEKPIQQIYIDLFKRMDIPYFHQNPSAGKYQTRNIPDLIFFYNGKTHLREIGIFGRHTDRKKQQLLYMQLCEHHAQDSLTIKLIFTAEAALQDLKELRIIK